MKKGFFFHITLITVLLLINTFQGMSQEKLKPGFKIIENGSEVSPEQVEAALLKADMTNYRLKEKSVIISFESGLKAEIYSANQIKALGYNINPEDYQTEFPDHYELPLFQLGENQIILAQIKKRSVK